MFDPVSGGLNTVKDGSHNFSKEWKELRGACGGEKERKVTVEGREKKERRVEGGEEEMAVASQKDKRRFTRK
jgi:hypothetical protein